MVLWMEDRSGCSQPYIASGSNTCDKLVFDDGRIHPSHGCQSWALGTAQARTDHTEGKNQAMQELSIPKLKARSSLKLDRAAWVATA